jgi:hypothetical protein
MTISLIIAVLAGVAGAECDTRGANGRGNPRAVCDRRLREAVRRCNTVNEFRVGKHGRARKDDRCNIGAVVGKRVHHVMGHILGACETFGT